MKELRFMGRGDPEPFRCRIYGDVSDDDKARAAFVERLGTVGVIDAPAWDTWIDALDAAGWLHGSLEPNPEGDGYIKRWTLSDYGRAEWAQLKGDAAKEVGR